MDNSTANATCLYESGKSKGLTNVWMTVFTPSYQRAKTLKRTYESLLGLQLPRDKNGNEVKFEWLIVDDGSTDGTDSLVRRWCGEDRLPIRYYYQENQGKHVATNLAVDICRSEMFLILDSDDTLLPWAMEVFYHEWQRIDDKEAFKGVSGRCLNPDTNCVIGSGFPPPSGPDKIRYYIDADTRDMRFKYHIKGEMCGFVRTDIMRAYPFPTPDRRMRFCPENVVWYEMAKKYKERIVNIPVRVYFKDTGNAIMGKSMNRSVANYYGWKYGVNNLLPYIFYSPKGVLKYFIGLSMDGFRTNRSVTQILHDADSTVRRLLVALFMPLGYLLSKRS